LSFLGGTSGQAMVEFALVLPLLVLLTIGAVNFGIVVKDWINVTNSAGVAARAAVVARFGPQTNCQAANAAVDPALRPVDCHCNPSGEPDQCAANDQTITVSLDRPWSVSVPFLPFSPGGRVTGSVTEKLE
jgi:hypothetical protein